MIVNAGPSIGYGHAVRTLRLAKELASTCDVRFFPLSDECAEFVKSAGATIGSLKNSLPPVVVTDLRATHGITSDIRRSASRHISIHDLGLGQCNSDVAIDGSVMTVFPYPPFSRVYSGPRYMIAREPVTRKPAPNTVFLSLGGGRTSDATEELAQALADSGLNVFATRGFQPGIESRSNVRIQWISTESDVRSAMATSSIAVTSTGISLYDAVSSGIPTIGLAFDCLQLRTAEAFHERGAAVSAGLWERTGAEQVATAALELARDRSLAERVGAAGKSLVDGKGVQRVAEIVRREVCPRH